MRYIFENIGFHDAFQRRSGAKSVSEISENFACGAKTVNYYNFCTFSEYFLLCLRPSALKTEEKEEKRENKKIERKEKRVFINTRC